MEKRRRKREHLFPRVRKSLSSRFMSVKFATLGSRTRKPDRNTTRLKSMLRLRYFFRLHRRLRKRKKSSILRKKKNSTILKN